MQDYHDAAKQRNYLQREVQRAVDHGNQPDAVWIDAEVVFVALDQELDLRLSRGALTPTQDA